MSDNAWPFPTARAAGRFRRCTAREDVAWTQTQLKQKRRWLRVKHKVSWDRVWNMDETSVAELPLDDFDLTVVTLRQ